MTATYTTLIAIKWNRDGVGDKGTVYEVISEIETGINTRLLKEDGLLHKASENHFYWDNAAVIAKNDFPKYFIENGKKKSDAEKWFNKLDDYVMFIVVHEAEYETGLDV